MAFYEVWNDLVAEFEEPVHIQPLDRGSSFTARVDVDSQELLLDTEAGSWNIPAEAIIDLWQQVRQAGFVAADDLPCGLDKYAKYIVPVVARLPYLHPVAMAAKYESFSRNLFGLRVSARSRESQPDLLPSVGGSFEPR